LEQPAHSPLDPAPAGPDALAGGTVLPDAELPPEPDRDAAPFAEAASYAPEGPRTAEAEAWEAPAPAAVEHVAPHEAGAPGGLGAPLPVIPEVAPFEARARSEPPDRRDPPPEPAPPSHEPISVAAAVPLFEPRPPEPLRAPPPLEFPRSPEPPRPPPPEIAPLREPVWSRSESPAVTFPQREPAEADRLFRVVLRYAGMTLLGLTALVLTLIVLYRWINPPASTLMLGQRLTGTTIVQRWVPLERMSPHLPLAVIMSEDGRFCRHHGVDWEEIEQALDRARDGVPRGGSTISMQVIKNLFLWPSKSYLRKAIEIPLTYIAEAVWPKQRMLEIYLNIAEWGPGVFGAEAAARYHFRKPASLLTPREAALLAVALPNPFERRAGAPGPGTSRLADNLMLRMRAAPGNAACARARSRPAGG
jgi:monofunctional biosynthetic peptidoglycan transglycosylase